MIEHLAHRKTETVMQIDQEPRNYFRYDILEEFLRSAHGSYGIRPLCEAHGAPGILLRHDVDFDVGAAYELAKLERRCGVRSTFLFLTTTGQYNLLAAENRGMLREMAEWDFDVGLHFDPLIYESADPPTLAAAVDQEADLIAQITGRPVRSISIHNPSIHGQYPLFDGYVNAYDPQIFSPETYLSDSRMMFRHDLAEFAARAKTQTVQILLHPLHYTRHGEGYPQIASNIALRRIFDLDSGLRVNSTYDRTVRPSLAAVTQQLHFSRGAFSHEH
jgi:hypothetical protein